MNSVNDHGTTSALADLKPKISIPVAAGNGNDAVQPVMVGKAVVGYVCPYNQDMTLQDLAWATAAIATWVVAFCAGILIPAQKAMEVFWGAQLPSLLDAITYGPVVVLSYSVCNLLFLACSAAVLGCVAQRWQVSDELRVIPHNVALAPCRRVYISAVLRGFFLYLLALGGFVLVSSYETLATVKFDQYIRIAGMVSLFSFVLGYDPNLVANFIQRVVEAMPSAGQVIPESDTQPVAGEPRNADGRQRAREQHIPETADQMETRERDAE